MKIGYILRYDLELNPQLTKSFEFKEANFTRKISSRGDNIRSKLLCYSVPYEEIVDNANVMKENPKIILIGEPFLLDDILRDKVIRWVNWANETDPRNYDPFAE